MSIATYRCKHLVEAKQWIDTDENRVAFADWFDAHNHIFQTRGSVILIADCSLNLDLVQDTIHVLAGEWVLWSHGEFISMDDESFRDQYEAA